MTVHIDKTALRKLIAAARQDASASALPTVMSSPAAVAAFSREHGLHASFTQLLLTLASHDLDYWQQAVDHLPARGDTAAMVRQWMNWVWSDPEVGLRKRISTPALLAQADAVFDMHQGPSSGLQRSGREWRQARSAVAKAMTDNPLENAAAQGAMAIAWNFDDVPAAAADMLHAWQDTLYAEIDRKLEWNAQKTAAAAERQNQMVAAANESAKAAGDALGGADLERTPEQLQHYQQQISAAFGQVVRDYSVMHPSELDRRGVLSNEASSQLYQLGRAALLRQLEVAASPELDLDLFVLPMRHDDLLAWAVANGLHAPSVLLIASLAISDYLEPLTRVDDARQFVEAAVAALPAAQQQLPSVPQRWFVRLYDGMPDSLRSRLLAADNAADVAAADAVIAMHRAVAEGKDMSARQWREARKHIGTPASPAMQAILASMWDQDTSAGVMADVALLWITESALADAVEQGGWSMAQYHAYKAIWSVHMSRKIPQEAEPGETAQAFAERQTQILNQPSGLSPQQEHMAAMLFQTISPLALSRRKALRQLLLEVLADSTPA